MPLLRIIAERRPDLAARLEELQRRSPQRFEEVLADALMFRLEDTLGDAEPGEAPPADERRGGAPASRPAGPRGPGPQASLTPELRAELRRLNERQEQLETRSQELAVRLREAKLADPEKTQLRDELKQAITEQFEVRSELRRFELERLQREVERIRAAVDRLQTELQRRTQEKSAIIDRRLEQLMGTDAGGW
jgi:hypothetical protein